MIYPIIIITAIFLLVAFVITKDNAKYLLAGYNTASEEQRKEVDIDRYIPFLKKFHLFLALSFLALGLFITYLLGEYAGGVFTGIYPLIAYLYFIIVSRRFSSGAIRKRSWISILLLCIVLVFVCALFAFGLKEDALVLKHDGVTIEGIYGEKIPYDSIRSFALKAELPMLAFKTNALALGTVKKGYFRTEEQETVKIITNSGNAPFLMIEKFNGEKLFFSTNGGMTTVHFQALQQRLPSRAR